MRRACWPPPVFPQNFATLTQNQCNHYLQLAQSTGIHMPRTILSEGGGVSTA